MNAPSRRHAAIVRVFAASTLALAFALGVYVLLEATRPETGLVSFSFLLILPAAVCAFVAYLSDPWAERSHRDYMLVPLWLLLAVVLASAFILREGVICIVLLSPLWLISGLIGAQITYRLRRRETNDRVFCSALFTIPLVAMQVEPMIPMPTAEPVVSRTIVIDATPQEIWPLLKGIPDVRIGEGRWNVSQDVIGIPRPIGARLVGNGIGADRFADWGDRIKFRERITEWQPGRAIGWRFIFDDVEGWRFTDRHLMPNSRYFQITTGGYRLDPVDAGRTRLTLHTRYRITTPVNGYSELWGQLFLGDVENNLLALVKGRAERAGRSARPKLG